MVFPERAAPRACVFCTSEITGSGMDPGLPCEPWNFALPHRLAVNNPDSRPATAEARRECIATVILGLGGLWYQCNLGAESAAGEGRIENAT